MNKQIYYRLIALWVLCEAMLGGIIHGLKIPVSGLFVGSSAVVCICLIAWYVPQKGAIIKATIIVAIFKMMLSPQAPPPAYIAVFFQGLLGEILFLRSRKLYAASCIILAVLSLLESGLQRILVLTVVYGNDLWVVINNFFNGLTKQKIATNYSLLIGAAYVLIHFITGLLVGWWAATLPKQIERWRKQVEFHIELNENEQPPPPSLTKKRRRLKKFLFIVWVLLIILYIQSYFNIGKPLLPSHIVLKILLRSFIIVLSWIFIISPLLKQILYRWLQKKKAGLQQEITAILQLLPTTQHLIVQSWKQTATHKSWKRIKTTAKIILVNSLTSSEYQQRVYILTGPIQSGKTTALYNWSADRNDVYGIITPVINGKRMFMNVQTKEQFPMEATDDDKETLSVGRFTFSKAAFKKASQTISDTIPGDQWLIIDEIGPLELSGKGFSAVIEEILKEKYPNLIFVVRKTLLEEVVTHYKLEKAIVVENVDSGLYKNHSIDINFALWQEYTQK